MQIWIQIQMEILQTFPIVKITDLEVCEASVEVCAVCFLLVHEIYT